MYLILYIPGDLTVEFKMIPQTRFYHSFFAEKLQDAI